MTSHSKSVAALRARAEGQFTRPLPQRPPFPAEWREVRETYYMRVGKDWRETRHPSPPDEGPFVTVYRFDSEEGAFEATATFPRWNDKWDNEESVRPPGAAWKHVTVVRDGTSFRHRPWIGDRFPSWEYNSQAGGPTLWRRPYSAERYRNAGGDHG